MNNSSMAKSNKIRNYGLIIFSVITVIVWNLPSGGLILYPFTLLGTWFHEFAHGLAAMLLGGNFNELAIFPNGSGYAKFSYSSLFFGGIGQSIVAAAGPIGPSLAGALMVISSVNVKSAKIAMYIFSFLLIASTVIWVRPIISWGFLIVLIFAVVITLIALKANDNFKIFTLQFIAVQAFLSVYLGIGYLFSSGAFVDGSNNLSDTAVIADNLLLPYWFWGALILILNLYLVYVSFNYYLKKVQLK